MEEYIVYTCDMKRIVILIVFLVNTIGPCPPLGAQELRLPTPGVMVHLSPPLEPPIFKGIKIYPDNPFRFDFILDQGDSARSTKNSQQEQLRIETKRLIKYFLASLTIPDKDLWVNLSPYEKDRIIPTSFGLTEMGRDLLAEDYMLKQITASLIYPEGEVGRKFWKRTYEEAIKRYGTTNIPVNTFNKVWIVPDKAVVYENAKAGTAYLVESSLRVMLEQDYLALEKNQHQTGGALVAAAGTLGSQIMREIVIPELIKEVNEDKNFAKLRQVYNSLILATWYKKKIKYSILAEVYDDRRKVAGVGYDQSIIPVISDRMRVQGKNPRNMIAKTFPNDTELIYQRYLQAFKKGAYNYINEELDPVTKQMVSRKYFSGGEALYNVNEILKIGEDQAMLSRLVPLIKSTLYKVGFSLSRLKVNGEPAIWRTEIGPQHVEDGASRAYNENEERITETNIPVTAHVKDIFESAFKEIGRFGSRPKLDKSRFRIAEDSENDCQVIVSRDVDFVGEALRHIIENALDEQGYGEIDVKFFRQNKEVGISVVNKHPNGKGIDYKALKSRAVEYAKENKLKRLPNGELAVMQDFDPNHWVPFDFSGSTSVKSDDVPSDERLLWIWGLSYKKTEYARGGWGYGLYNTKTMIDKAGGRIEVESGVKETGFTVFFKEDTGKITRNLEMQSSRDRAQMAIARNGGIDFNPKKMNLQVQNNTVEIKFHLDPAQLAQFQNAPGMVPVDINIQPMTDVRQFLGMPS